MRSPRYLLANHQGALALFLLPFTPVYVCIFTLLVPLSGNKTGQQLHN